MDPEQELLFWLPPFRQTRPSKLVSNLFLSESLLPPKWEQKSCPVLSSGHPAEGHFPVQVQEESNATPKYYLMLFIVHPQSNIFLS